MQHELTTSQLANEHFIASRTALFIQTNKLLASTLLLEWAGCLVIAIVISPKTWAGGMSWTHPHVWGALVLGGIVVSLPCILTYFRPLTSSNRYLIATAHMLMAGLAVHLTGGRLATHFMYFGVMAFLACYRDWSVLLLAAVVAAADHLAREFFWPQSLYGVDATSGWL